MRILKFSILVFLFKSVFASAYVLPDETTLSKRILAVQSLDFIKLTQLARNLANQVMPVKIAHLITMTAVNSFYNNYLPALYGVSGDYIPGLHIDKTETYPQNHSYTVSLMLVIFRDHATAIGEISTLNSTVILTNYMKQKAQPNHFSLATYKILIPQSYAFLQETDLDFDLNDFSNKFHREFAHVTVKQNDILKHVLKLENIIAVAVDRYYDSTDIARCHKGYGQYPRRDHRIYQLLTHFVPANETVLKAVAKLKSVQSYVTFQRAYLTYIKHRG